MGIRHLNASTGLFGPFTRWPFQFPIIFTFKGFGNPASSWVCTSTVDEESGTMLHLSSSSHLCNAAFDLPGWCTRLALTNKFSSICQTKDAKRSLVGVIGPGSNSSMNDKWKHRTKLSPHVKIWWSGRNLVTYGVRRKST